jgi:hypothetical protein
LNTGTNSFVGICDEPNLGLKLQKSEINMASSGAIGSVQNGHGRSGDQMRGMAGQFDLTA